MLSRVIHSFAFVIVMLAVTAQARSAPGVPWDRVRDAVQLDEEQRRVAEAVLRAARCYGGCDGTILDCLLIGDPIGSRLASFVARRVVEGREEEAILKSIEARRLSAYAPDTCQIDLSLLVPAGDPDAPIQVVVYADFNCSYCRIAGPGLRELNLAMPHVFSLWFKTYPLSQDERGVPAALAYLAVERQGKGWEMFDMLFGNTSELTDATLEGCAAGAGADLEQYRADIRNDALVQRVRTEKNEGVVCGVSKTPGIFVNGKRYRGIKTRIELLDRIEEESDLLARKK